MFPRLPVVQPTSRQGVSAGSHSAKRNTGRRSRVGTAGKAISALDTVPPGAPAEAALRFLTDRGYGTVSSALIALPAVGLAERRPVFRFAGWLPEATPWREVGGR